MLLAYKLVLHDTKTLIFTVIVLGLSKRHAFLRIGDNISSAFPSNFFNNSLRRKPCISESWGQNKVALLASSIIVRIIYIIFLRIGGTLFLLHLQLFA